MSCKWFLPQALLRSPPIFREAIRQLSPGASIFFPSSSSFVQRSRPAPTCTAKSLRLAASVLLPTTRPSWLLKSSAAIRNKSPCCSSVANPSRLSALTSGTVHATVFSEPFASVAVKQGMRSLIDLADSGVSFPQNSFVVRRSVLAEKRPMIVNAIKASIETLYLLKKDRKFAREVLKKYLRIDDDAMIDIGIDYYLTRHGEGILTLPDRKGIEFVIADTAKTNPKAKGQTPESLRVLDASVLDEIKKSGFIEKVKG